MKKMHIRLMILAKTTIAMLSVGVVLALPHAMAQGMSKIDKTKLVGSWALVSANVTYPDGKTVQTFGPNDGFVVFETNGRFVQALLRSDIPKIASNNRSTGSPDENKAVVQGSLVFFGTYTVNEDGRITRRAERSTFSNLNGTDRDTIITSLTADELKLRDPAPTIGGAAEQVWKRIK